MYANKVETKEKIKITWHKKNKSNIYVKYSFMQAEGIETLSRKEIFVQNLRFFFVTPLIFNSLTGKQFCLLKSSIKPSGGLIYFKHTWGGEGRIWEGELI